MSDSAAAAEPVSWTGAYIGINGGIDVGQNGLADGLGYSAPSFSSSAILNVEQYNHVTVGGIFGPQIGVNWQFAQTWLVGLEADWVFDDSENIAACVASCLQTVPGPPFANYAISLTDQERLHWFATLRPRLGYITGDTLWFLTAGGVLAGIDVELRENVIVAGVPSPLVPSTAAISPTHTNLGFTVGGGIETRITGNWSLKAEYLYLDLGGVIDSFSVSEAGNTSEIPGAMLETQTNSHLHDHIFRAGLNYKFWSWPVSRPSSSPSISAGGLY
jgi:outer membrane immunogenic protein